MAPTHMSSLRISLYISIDPLPQFLPLSLSHHLVMTTQKSNKLISAIKKTTSSYYANSRIQPSSMEIHRGVAKDNFGCSIGPMPVQDFLDRFMPTTRKSELKVAPDFFESIPTDGNEKERYQPFVDIVTKSGEFPGLEFAITSNSKDPKAKHSLFPDLVTYSDQAKRDALLLWALVEFFIEWKVDLTSDGYDRGSDKNDILDLNSNAAMKSRGQMYSYAAQIMDNQFRLFVFAIAVYGDCARFFRFDPSSIVVTDVFNYREDPTPLVDFIKWYCGLSPAQRGYDTTVTPANKAEQRLFRARVKAYDVRVRNKKLRKHPGVHDHGEIFKVQVNDMDGKIHYYLVTKPTSAPANLSPCGKLTRGFIATPAEKTSVALDSNKEEDGMEQSDGDKGKLFWLKDYWRSASCVSELAMYHLLKNNRVPNLPHIRHAGDVKDGTCFQETTNDTLLSEKTAESWRRPTNITRHLIHLRIILELLIPLEEVENAKDLLLVGRDVMETFKITNVCHRDLCKTNIMMTEARSDSDSVGPWGILSDWDCSKIIGRTTLEYNVYTTSWQFTSIALLANPTKPHDVCDDLESLLWVLLCVALERFEHTGSTSDQIFDEISEQADETLGRVDYGGNSKTKWLSSSRMSFKCKPLASFFQKYRAFHKEYQACLALVLESEAGRQKFERYQKDILNNICRLTSYFDDILDDLAVDWSDQESHKNQVSQERLNKKQRHIDKVQARVIQRGNWLGGGQYRAKKSDSETTTRPVLNSGTSQTKSSLTKKDNQAKKGDRHLDIVGSKDVDADTKLAAIMEEADGTSDKKTQDIGASRR
ncbi:hypothetical protein QCA50_008744 [Cerrena zonata]|uniref:Fungal-type protein kinase domain-containing protein n=1 Tax=Cerrena zonata TaxID=2478898 RepID=A0AAW0G4W1_9APHY